MGNQDQRSDARARLDAVAFIGSGDIETSAEGVNASRTGIALRSSLLWAPGSRVRVRLRVKSETFAARAVVERVDGDVMGLTFIATGPALRRLLEAA
ncbi:MAG: PilZ domain-containing protein [Polyangiaceae bacterium]